MIIYKMNVLKALKEKGYNTKFLRDKKILSQATIQNLRNDKYISFDTLDILCKLLECSICDIIEYIPQKEIEKSESESESEYKTELNIE